MNASGGGAEGNPNQRLLCRVGEPEMFPFSHHAQIVPGIFPSHPPHFMLIQPGNEGTVFVVTAAVVQHPVKPGHSADANGRTGVHVDFSQKLQLREGAGVVQRDFIKQIHDSAHCLQPILQHKDLRGTLFQRQTNTVAHLHKHLGGTERGKVRDQMDEIRVLFMKLGQHRGLTAAGIAVKQKKFVLGVRLTELPLGADMIVKIHVWGLER